jgi:hypothetical protein
MWMEPPKTEYQPKVGDAAQIGLEGVIDGCRLASLNLGRKWQRPKRAMGLIFPNRTSVEIVPGIAMKQLHQFLFFFGLQFLSYAVITWNYRAVAQARYLSIGLSDLVCAGLGFTAIKRVSATEGRAALAGYVLGGACGSILSAWITRAVYGQ